MSSHQLPHPRTIVRADTEIPAITLDIYTDEGPTTGNVIPATTSIHKDQRRHIVNDAGRLTPAKNCRHLAEFARDLPVVMQFDAHCEVTPSASRTHLTMLYTVASGNAALSRRVTELVGREGPGCPDNEHFWDRKARPSER